LILTFSFPKNLNPKNKIFIPSSAFQPPVVHLLA